MGFNNGYDAGWQDCELQNRAKWEKAAAEKALANAPSAPALDLGLLADYDVEKLFSATSATRTAYLGTLSNEQLNVLAGVLGTSANIPSEIDTAAASTMD